MAQPPEDRGSGRAATGEPDLPNDGPRVVVIHLADRERRLALDRALRGAGIQVRLTSRPAELAKAVADGRVQVVVCDTLTRAHVDAMPVSQARQRPPVLVTAPADSPEAVLAQITALGVRANPRP